jgi:copper chaperone CopZ
MLDHEAIFKAYPDACVIDDEAGVKRIDGTKITLVQSDIDAARATLDAEYAALEYSRNRAAEYPSVVDQLDLIYHSGIDAWKAKIKETKDKYPKP